MKLFIFSIISALTLFSCTAKKDLKKERMTVTQAVQSENVVLLDVRVREQFQKESAKNAVNIPLAELENRSSELKGKKVVVFCNKGIQADEAYKILEKDGVEVYDGSTLKNVQAIQNLKN
jgi:rhodanese-related sulfurtransferase